LSEKLFISYIRAQAFSASALLVGQDHHVGCSVCKNTTLVHALVMNRSNFH